MFKFALVTAALLLGCTQHNPAVCCNTPTQCSDLQLDHIYGCDSGKVCDPNGACVSPKCATSVECSGDSPYCASDGLCSSQCASDAECPGGDQAPGSTHCVGGQCVECGASSDCPVDHPVCDGAACRSCQSNEECASQLCGSEGACVSGDLIAYASSDGADSGPCDKTAPCNLGRAVSLGRAFTVVNPGTYTQTDTLSMAGTNAVIGIGATLPVITRSTPGPIITVGANAHLHLEHLQLSGATNTSATVIDGDAILCPNTFTARSVEVVDVLVTANGGAGVNGVSCELTASRSAFTYNGSYGVYIANHPLTADRCEFSFNVGQGIDFDGTIPRLTNCFMTKNGQEGLLSVGFGTGGYVRFCTIAGNMKRGAQIGHSDPIEVSNNLLAGNVLADLTCNSNCVSTGNLALGTDTTTAHFKNLLDDFHITAGSVAIDAAVGGTEDHDFDGDVRPKGAARDVGADEAQ